MNDFDKVIGRLSEIVKSLDSEYDTIVDEGHGDPHGDAGLAQYRHQELSDCIEEIKSLRVQSQKSIQRAEQAEAQERFLTERIYGTANGGGLVREIESLREQLETLKNVERVRKAWLDERVDALCMVASALGPYYKDAEDGSLDFKNLHKMIKKMISDYELKQGAR